MSWHHRSVRLDDVFCWANSVLGHRTVALQRLVEGVLRRLAVWKVATDRALGLSGGREMKHKHCRTGTKEAMISVTKHLPNTAKKHAKCAVKALTW